MNDNKNAENDRVVNNNSPKSNNLSENKSNEFYHSTNNKRNIENPNKNVNNPQSNFSAKEETLPKENLQRMTNPQKPKPFTPAGASNSNLNSLSNKHRKNSFLGMSHGISQQSDEQEVPSSNPENSKSDNSKSNNSTSENKNGNNRPQDTTPKEDNSPAEKSESKLNKINNALNKVKKFKNPPNNSAKSNIKGELVKKLMKNPYVLLILLGGLLFLLLLIIIIGFFAGESAYGSVGNYCTTKQFDISDLADTSVKTFEDGLINWVNPSPQYTFFTTTETYTDEDGFLRAGDAYVVALGTYFGEEKGTKYLVTLENGKEFSIILGDTKADIHTDSTNRYAKNGDIIEFMRGCGDNVGSVTAHKGNVPKCGTVAEFQSKIYELFPGNIASIKLLSDTRYCNFNGQFYERNSSIYIDKNAINRILEIAPGVQGNYAIGLRYECVTYAKMRAIEILDNNTVLTEEQRKKAINDVGYAQGNGWQWTAQDNPGLKKFNSDSSCTNFKAGSIIAYNGNGASCTETINGKLVTHKCGHVAIIESVDLEKGTYTISDSWSGLKGAFRKLTLNINDKNTTFGGCRGITYLLEYMG